LSSRNIQQGIVVRLLDIYHSSTHMFNCLYARLPYAFSFCPPFRLFLQLINTISNIASIRYCYCCCCCYKYHCKERVKYAGVKETIITTTDNQTQGNLSAYQLNQYNNYVDELYCWARTFVGNQNEKRKRHMRKRY